MSEKAEKAKALKLNPHKFYCEAIGDHPLHAKHHDDEYGYPVTDETVLFERLCLEVFQAGLNWLLVLKKRPAFNAAFDDFDVDKVAGYGEAKIEQLLQDEGIVRNRLKIHAIMHNANVTKGLRSEGGLSGWLDSHHPRSLTDWVQTFRKTFKFMGPEVVKEFLMSTGYIPGAHHTSCLVFKTVYDLHPPWRMVEDRLHDFPDWPPIEKESL